MINFQYLVSELTRRRQRTFINSGLVALVTAILLCITLLAGALNRAFQAPLQRIGANMTVQLSGDVPEQMAGAVLPCSVAPIGKEQSDAIAALPGVVSMSRALLFWDFSGQDFRIVVGFRPGDPAGPALLRGALVQGRMIDNTSTAEALAEITWAERQGIGLNDRLSLAGRSLTIVGLVDISALSRIGTANLYIPLTLAQEIVSSAPGVTGIHSFGPQDSNILFIRSKRDETEAIAQGIRKILGPKSSVSTPASFKQLLGGLFSITQRFSTMISGMVLILALLLIVRNSIAALRERALEIGIMKAVGWTGADIRGQLLAEQWSYIGLGLVLGLIVVGLTAWGLSFVTIAIPIPWDMAPTPHFLPGGDRQLVHEVRLDMTPDLHSLLLLAAVPLLLGPAAAWSGSHLITRLQTSEVLRHE